MKRLARRLEFCTILGVVVGLVCAMGNQHLDEHTGKDHTYHSSRRSTHREGQVVKKVEYISLKEHGEKKLKPRAPDSQSINAHKSANQAHGKKTKQVHTEVGPSPIKQAMLNVPTSDVPKVSRIPSSHVRRVAIAYHGEYIRWLGTPHSWEQSLSQASRNCQGYCVCS